MNSSMETYDAVVIGGGFYGCCVALHLRRRGLRRIVVLEREDTLLQHASYVNQARLHNGYHYPRSFRTAARSRNNFGRFAADFPQCVVDDFRKVYCIARRNSKVGSRHFERFCRLIHAPLRPAPATLRKLFNPALIEAVYDTKEYAFDAAILGRLLQRQIAEAGVEVRYRTKVEGLRAENGRGDRIRVDLDTDTVLTTPWVFNCTYSCLNYIPGARSSTATVLKHEITEIALVEPPAEVKDMGITVMDGPFFSIMPFPPRGLHSLTHVRYTPHFSWIDRGAPDQDPYRVLAGVRKQSHFPFMLRDAVRYMPVLAGTRYVESLYEVKTVLVDSEVDDSRPILFDRNAEVPGIVSILGGKIDNIYDILDFLDEKLDLDPCR